MVSKERLEYWKNKYPKAPRDEYKQYTAFRGTLTHFNILEEVKKANPVGNFQDVPSQLKNPFFQKYLQPQYEIPYFGTFYLPSELEVALIMGKNWISTWNPRPINSGIERRFISPRYQVGGTADLLCKFPETAPIPTAPGKVDLVDIKTGKEIYDEAIGLQLVAYAEMAAQEGYPIGDSYCLRIHPDLKNTVMEFRKVDLPYFDAFMRHRNRFREIWGS